MENKYEIKIAIRFSENGFEIYNSYLYKSHKLIKKILIELMNDVNYKQYNYTRTLKSYEAEWRFHNFLYNLHLFRSHTKDTFFDKEFPKTFRGFLEKTIYKIISLFIK